MKNLLKILLLLGIFGFIPFWVHAQSQPDSTKIAEINRLGMMLYQYDQAAWHGTDAILPLLENVDNLPDLIEGFVVKQTDTGWSKAFGRIDSKGDETVFHIVFEAFLDEDFNEVSSHFYEDNKPDTGFYLNAMMARNKAVQRFDENPELPYNSVVLPISEDLFYVYLMPAQPAINVYYVGGDVRFTYSVAGQAIIDNKVLHQKIIPIDLRDEKIATTISTRVLYDYPVETDVFFAMSRLPVEGTRLRHIVMTEKWIFMLGANGIFDHRDTKEYLNQQFEN